MAAGDLIVFEEAKKTILTGGWEAADAIWIGLTSDTPVVSDTIPAYASGGTTNYTAVATGGNYAAGGELLATYDAMTTEAGGTVTFDDTGASVSWAQDASNPTNARYALVYNKTQSNLCIIMIDLGAIIDMTAGALTITWNASGMFTLT